MNLKKALLLAGVGIGVVALAYATQAPFYSTKSAYGTTTATVIFPSQAGLQARLVSDIAYSDKAASVLAINTGTTPFIIGASNNAGTTITVTYTNGFSGTPDIVIEGAAGTAYCTISSYSGTNITLSATDGIATVPGDQVYVMGTASSLPVGATTATYEGEALFVGNVGRPLAIKLDGTSHCTNITATVRYE